MTIGVIGYGHIGTKVVRLLHAFGSRILVADPNFGFRRRTSNAASSRRRSRRCCAKATSFRCTRASPPRRAGSLGAARSRRCATGAYFIDTARRSWSTMTPLRDALKSGRLGGAALETFAVEPSPSDLELLRLDNVTLTPYRRRLPPDDRARGGSRRRRRAPLSRRRSAAEPVLVIRRRPERVRKPQEDAAAKIVSRSAAPRSAARIGIASTAPRRGRARARAACSLLRHAAPSRARAGSRGQSGSAAARARRGRGSARPARARRGRSPRRGRRRRETTTRCGRLRPCRARRGRRARAGRRPRVGGGEFGLLVEARIGERENRAAAARPVQQRLANQLGVGARMSSATRRSSASVIATRAQSIGRATAPENSGAASFRPRRPAGRRRARRSPRASRSAVHAAKAAARRLGVAKIAARRRGARSLAVPRSRRPGARSRVEARPGQPSARRRDGARLRRGARRRALRRARIGVRSAIGASLNNTSLSRAKFLINGSAAPPMAPRVGADRAGDDGDVGQAAPIERSRPAPRARAASANVDGHRAVDDDRLDVDDRNRRDRRAGQRGGGVVDPFVEQRPEIVPGVGRAPDRGGIAPADSTRRSSWQIEARAISCVARRGEPTGIEPSAAALPVRPG